jgi:hypothetical protein
MESSAKPQRRQSIRYSCLSSSSQNSYCRQTKFERKTHLFRKKSGNIKLTSFHKFFLNLNMLNSRILRIREFRTVREFHFRRIIAIIAQTTAAIVGILMWTQILLK